MANATEADRMKPNSTITIEVEAWSQGLMVGALLIMAGITVANMKAGKLLHKLILAELLLAFPNGFFNFWNPPVWGWYLSSTAVFLIVSWSLHNYISWLKCKPFLQPRASYIFIGTIILAQPYWVLEIYANFNYFNGLDTSLFPRTRPYEAFFRDPWWVFTTINLFWNVKHRYEFGFAEFIALSPRFGILLLSMCLSILFILLDILAVTPVFAIGGINPFWKISFVFKCFTDTIILDDFKTAIDALHRHKVSQIRNQSQSNHKTQPGWVELRDQHNGSSSQHTTDPEVGQDDLEGIVIDTNIVVSVSDATKVSTMSSSACEIQGVVRTPETVWSKPPSPHAY